jgi:hypothetical protein
MIQVLYIHELEPSLMEKKKERDFEFFFSLFFDVSLGGGGGTQT